MTAHPTAALNVATTAENKAEAAQVMAACACMLQYSFQFMHNDLIVHTSSETGCHAPVTAVACSILQMHSGTAETIFNFWKLKMRMINRNNNRFVNY